MKPLTLYPHEIRRLLDTGSITVWRPMKPQPKWDTFGEYETWRWKCKGGHAHVWDEGREPNEVAFVNQCAPHPPGSERWVRETWATDIHNNGDSPKRIAELCREAGYEVGPNRPAGPIWYQADGAFRQWGDYDVQGKWRSPATMPRWASRLSVVAREVQARQVQSITEDECWESGVYRIGPELETPLPVMACEEPQVKEGMAFGYRENPFVSYAGKPRIAFMFLWDGRYNPRGYCPEDAPQGWDANPWAWATKLERKEG